MVLPLKKFNFIEPQYPSYVDQNHFGLCLRAKTDLPAGAVVATADFEPTDHPFVANSSDESYKYVAVMAVTKGWQPIYGRVRGKWAFCNHSCEPNCTLDANWQVITLRAVTANEELTTPYDFFVPSLPWQESWSFECLCQAPTCKKFINKYRADMLCVPLAQ